MKSTNKTLIALAISMAAIGASAQVDKAASNAADAAQHKVDQKRAEAKAEDSGPIGKAVNNTKAEYHKGMAEKNKNDAKENLGIKSKRTPAVTNDSTMPATTGEGGPGINNGTPPVTRPSGNS